MNFAVDLYATLKQRIINGVKYSICLLSKWKYSNIETESKICPNCGCLNKAVFPKEVAYPVQYGTRLKSVAIYLNQYQLVPFDRLSETFVDLFGRRLSQSTLIDSNRTCYNILGGGAKRTSSNR